MLAAGDRNDVAAATRTALAAGPGLPVRAEAHLMDLAQTYDWKKVTGLARHLMEVLDPDGADERLGRQLEAQETRAALATMLEIHDNGDGTHTGRFKIATLHAAMLTKALEAFLHPARHATGNATGQPASHHSESVVLDMGRERRFHTKHMRIALATEQHDCTTLGCQRPPGWCDVDHELSLGTPSADIATERDV